MHGLAGRFGPRHGRAAGRTGSGVSLRQVRGRTHWIRGFTASGPRPDALDPGFHCVRTHWIRGFMAFQLAWSTRSVRLMVPTWPESGFREGAARLLPSAAWCWSGMNAATLPEIGAAGCDTSQGSVPGAEQH
jgi:hypothetical protein